MRLQNRAGFALPVAILIIAILTAALAAGFASTTAETDANLVVRGQGRALAFAEAGLEEFLVKRQTLCSTAGAVCLNPDPSAGTTVDSEEVTVGFSGGSARIKSIRIRPHTSSTDTSAVLFFVRSRGIDSTVKIGGAGSTVLAQRVVGTYATWNTMTMQVLSAWTSISGLTKNGNAGIIDGNDQCGVKAAVAGVTSDRNDVVVSGGWQPSGNPPWDTSQTQAQLEARMKIDWNSIINGNAIPADFTVPPDAFPNASWFSADTSRWPVIRVHVNNYTLPNAGRGMIIADSNFTISGSNMWDGIVLVGGALTSNGNNTTAGATVSGLNLLLPGAVQPPPGTLTDNSVANGQKTYVYNSCKVARATTRMMSYRAMPNAWMDNLPSW